MDPHACLGRIAIQLAAREFGEALPAVAAAFSECLPLLRCGIAMVEAGQPWLRVLDTVGADEGPVRSGVGGKMPLIGTANGEAVRTGRPVVALPIADDGAWMEAARLRVQGAVGYLCLPLIDRGEVVGTLNLAFTEMPAQADRLVSDLEPITQLLAAALMRHRLQQQVVRLTGALRRRNAVLDAEMERLGAIRPVACSDAFRRTLDEVERVAVTDVHVLLSGPTGSGKEVLARHLHRTSPRAEGPFVVINCAALPESLAESELFGHRRGAFTGAATDHRGLFERASGGTLFLDEVGELSDRSQARLLRALQERAITPLGAERSVAADARIVAATNRDLMGMVRDGCFRLDLYHRLTAFPISVPPLSARREDIPELVTQFVIAACLRANRPVPELGEAVLDALQERHYPGNVRELRNLVERALVFSDARLQLPPDELPMIAALVRSAVGAQATEDGWLTLHQIQRRHIEATLRHTGGKFYGPGGAAQLLGLAPSTLKSRMERLGLRQSPAPEHHDSEGLAWQPPVPSPLGGQDR